MKTIIPTAESMRITNLKEYNKIHKWIRDNYGKANKCENSECSRISKTFDWALKTGYEQKTKSKSTNTRF